MSDREMAERIRAASRRLEEWMRERRSRPAGLLPEPGQLRCVDEWLADAGAALRALSTAGRDRKGTQADIAEYKQRLCELQILLREMETQGLMRRSELQGASAQMSAVSQWAKRVREIG
jgi:hypothetical protein